MNSAVGEKYAAELVKLFEQQGPSLYSGQHSLCLTMPCLNYLQRKFSALQEGSGHLVPVRFDSLQFLQDNLAKIQSLKLISDRRYPIPPTLTLSLEPFKALQTLVLKRVPLQLVTGLVRLRAQLRVLVITRCQMGNIEEVIVRCGGDDTTVSFAWNSLRELDLSNNDISKLGNSLQYLPVIEKVNFSNNNIGDTTTPGSGSNSSNGGSGSGGGGGSDQCSTAGRAEGDEFTEGIVCIDSVSILHLGFNKLSSIPHFGDRAKYNLRVLILRNNRLDSAEGLEVLDSLVELDLTDNLLSKHTSLKPCKNLHHLAMLVLVGNPLSFHNKHRLKTAEHLSNLVNRNNFRLDGKKLSATEKKAISNSITHYGLSPSALRRSINTRSFAIPFGKQQSMFGNASMARSMPDPGTQIGGDERVMFTSAPNSPNLGGGFGKRRRKNDQWNTVKIVDSDDEEDIMSTKSAPGSTKSSRKERDREDSVPLLNEDTLIKTELLRRQLDEDWLKSANASSSTTTDDRSTSTSLSQTTTSRTTTTTSSGSSSNRKKPLSRSSSLKGGKNKGRRGRRRSSQQDRNEETMTAGRGVKSEGVMEKECDWVHGPRTSSPDRKSEGVMEEECEGVYGPRTSSPDRGIPYDASGECFLVERYESDVEEDSVNMSAGHYGNSLSNNIVEEILIVLSERYIEEQNNQGKLLDRWDLHCLQDASIEEKPCKLSGRDAGNQMSEVLHLQYNLDRRDRCSREYVLLEEGAGEKLLEILMPIVKQNQATLSMGNRIECLHCQRVFDMTQAVDEPSDDPQPLYSVRRRSLSKLMCPHCHSQILQYSMPTTPRSIKKSSPHSNSPSLSSRHNFSPNGAAASSAEPLLTTIATRDNFKSGFSLDDDRLNRKSNSSSPSPSPSPSFAASVTTTRRLSATKQNSVLLDEENPLNYSNINGDIGVNDLLHSHYSPIIRSHGSTLPKSADVSKHEREEESDDRLVLSEPGFNSSEFNDHIHSTQRHMSTTEDDLSPWKTKKTSIKSQNQFDNSVNSRDEPGSNYGPPHVANRFSDALLESTEGFGGSTKKEERRDSNILEGSRESQASSNPFDENYSSNLYHGDGCTNDTAKVSFTGRPRTGAISGAFADPIPTPCTQNHRTTIIEDNDVAFQIQQFETSTSMPSRAQIDSASTASKAQDELETSGIFDGMGHNRSKSVDYHPKVTHNTTPPSKRKFEDPSVLRDTIQSTQSRSSSRSSRDGSQPGSRMSTNVTSHTSSRKSSLSSLNSVESSHGSCADVDASRRGFSSGERQRLKSNQPQCNSNEPTTKRYSPNEKSSSNSPKSSSSRLPISLLRLNAPGDLFKKDSLTVSRKKREGGGEGEFEKRLSSGSGSGNGRGSSGHRISSEGSGKRSSKSFNRSGSLKSSSESTTGQRTNSALTVCKDDNPSYIHSSFNVHLDLNVFENEKGEEFKMIFRSPVVQHGQPKEQPSLLVVSNLKAYVYLITAPENPHPDTWLKLLASHSLSDLVHIDIGVGYQLLRLEFISPNTCYSFLIRDEEKCTTCSTKLAYIVSDLPNSSFRNAGVCPFSMDMIRHPDRALREALLTHYDKISGRITPSRKRPPSAMSTKSTNSDDDELIMYRLAYRYVTILGRGRRRIPVTVVLTDSTIYLAKENFSQWPLPKLQALPERSTLKPPYEEVEQKELNDIEQIILDNDQTSHVTLRFFKETTVGEDNENSQWSLVMYNSACVIKLVESVKKPWESLFETTLPIIYK